MEAAAVELIEFRPLELGRVDGQKRLNQGTISNPKNTTTTPLEVGENRPKKI